MTGQELVTLAKGLPPKYRIVEDGPEFKPQYWSNATEMWIDFSGKYTSLYKAEARIALHLEHTRPNPKPNPKPKVVVEYWVTEEGLRHTPTDFTPTDYKK